MGLVLLARPVLDRYFLQDARLGRGGKRLGLNVDPFGFLDPPASAADVLQLPGKSPATGTNRLMQSQAKALSQRERLIECL